MLKTLALIALSCAIAIGGGAWSVVTALDHSASFGAVTVGPWYAYPDIGTPDADPYAQARYARDGSLALGRGEGIEFHAERDTSGAELDRNCLYAVEGAAPPSRFWTMHAAISPARPDDAQPIAVPGHFAALHSGEILRKTDGNFTVSVSRQPQPGNWIRIAGNGSFQVVLTLYDTPLANREDATGSALPLIRRVSCNG